MKKYLLLAAVVLAFSTTAWGYGISVTYSNTWTQAWMQTHTGINTLPWPGPTTNPWMWPTQWPGYNPCGASNPCGCNNPCDCDCPDPCPSPCGCDCPNPCPSPCGTQNPCQSPCGNVAWLWLNGNDCTPDCGCDCGCDCDCGGQTTYNPCVLWGIGCY